jgi:hypothetical protein
MKNFTLSPNTSGKAGTHDPALEYIPFRHCLTYLKEKSAAIPYSGKKHQQQRLDMMHYVGMTNYGKFYRRRMEWDRLQGRIPRDYLRHIGVDLEVLLFCHDLDCKEFETLLHQKRTTTYVRGIILAFFVQDILLPEYAYPEPEAIEFAHQIMKDEPSKIRHAVIAFKDIVSHQFSRGIGHVATSIYYPRLEITKTHIRRCEPLKVSHQQYREMMNFDG